MMRKPIPLHCFSTKQLLHHLEIIPTMLEFSTRPGATVEFQEKTWRLAASLRKEALEELERRGGAIDSPSS